MNAVERPRVPGEKGSSLPPRHRLFRIGARVRGEPVRRRQYDPSMTEAIDILERHPELRPRLIETKQIHAENRARRPTGRGAYEWWQIEAFDPEGSGVIVTLNHGDPFSRRYRRAIRRDRNGRLVDPAALRPETYPAVRIALFHKHRLLARGYESLPARSFRESAADEPWSIRMGETAFAEDGEGWTLRTSVIPQRIGLAGVLRPGAFLDSSISGSIEIEPRFHTTTLERSSLPDAPSGTSHSWLPACPSGRVRGQFKVEIPGRPVFAVDLSNAEGSVEHFWGTGPIGEGVRRWYRARLSWDEGAAIAELTIIRKYIQLAGTLMYFQPDKPAPSIVRCERPPTTVFQRSKWLLAFPTELTWHDPQHEMQLTHRISGLTDASPSRASCLSEATLQIGQAPDETIIGPHPGVFEIMQPQRTDWSLWHCWLHESTGST